MGLEMWRGHDSENFRAGFGVGGDHQVTEAYSSRFVKKMGAQEWAVVTIYFYGIGHTEADTCVPRNCTPGQVELEAMIEYSLCCDLSDIGGSEGWADMVYRRPDVNFESSIEPGVNRVDQEAFGLARTMRPHMILWDGKPFRSSQPPELAFPAFVGS